MGFTPLEGVPMATRSGIGRPRRAALALQTGRLSDGRARPRPRARVGPRGAGGLDSELGFGIYTRRVGSAGRGGGSGRARRARRCRVRRRGRREPVQHARGSGWRPARVPGLVRVEVVPAREELVWSPRTSALCSALRARAGRPRRGGRRRSGATGVARAGVVQPSTRPVPSPKRTGATKSEQLVDEAGARGTSRPSVGPPSSSSNWTPSSHELCTARPRAAPCRSSSSEPAGKRAAPEGERRGWRATAHVARIKPRLVACNVPIPTATASARRAARGRAAGSPPTSPSAGPGTVTRPSSETATL